MRRGVPGRCDPTGYVLSLNLHRRHLSESQRAMIAAKIADMKSGTRTDLEPSANLQKVSRAEAAEKLNVSERSVNTAKKVQSQGTAELNDPEAFEWEQIFAEV